MKNIFRDLWNDKPLLITAIVGLAALIFIIVRSNKNALVASGGTSTSDGSGQSAPYDQPQGGTYVMEEYSVNAPTSTVLNNPVASAAPIASLIGVATKGSLKSGGGAGKGDTNFNIYTVKPGDTLLSVTQLAKWGSNTTKLANYRNNSQILSGAGVNIGNPYAPLPAGMQLSI